MEKECILFSSKFQLEILQTERKLSWLEALYTRLKDKEKDFVDEVLASRKRSAKLEHELLLARRTNDKLLAFIQETKDQNKLLKTDFLEARKKVCILEAKISCMEFREKFLEKQVESANRNSSQVEDDRKFALAKMAKIQHANELLEKRKRDAVEELYELQAKNAEMEVMLQFMRKRKNCLCHSGKEVESDNEELMECDRELGFSTEDQLASLKRERDGLLERLHDTEREALESERRNSKLREQIAELTVTISDKDQQIRHCKQLFETTRRNFQEEANKLEASINKWQSKYKQCLVDLEKEANDNSERKEVAENKSGVRDTCWKCDLQLRACQSDISERDLKIAYLQKINYTHEDKMRQILNQYKKSEDIFDDQLLFFDGTVTDLHHQLQLLLAFYQKRAENVSAELEKWKELAIEARICREKETLLFESQLSLISKEYYAKYENYRASFEREKTQRLALESQTKRLTLELEECQKHFHFSRKELLAFKTRHESVHSKDNDNLITNVVTLDENNNITNHNHTPEFEQDFVFVNMAEDDVSVFPNAQMSQEDELSELKPDKLESKRDVIDIVEIADPREDAQVGTTAIEEEAVLLNTTMEGQIVESTNNITPIDSRDETTNQSMSTEIASEQIKDNELQSSCEADRNDNAAGGRSGQQSNSINCEAHEYEIQNLKQQLELANNKCISFEKLNSDLKAENEKLHSVVQALQQSVVLLESQNKLATNMSEAEGNVVDGATDGGVKEIEDALNESFAAQDITDNVDQETPHQPLLNEEAINEEKAAEEVQSNSESTTPTRSPHSSLPRTKLPSAASTAPIPFGKRHSHAGITSSHRTNRPRAGSTEFGTAADRRASVGSDANDEDGKPKQPPVKKYSTSHLDNFKPKPFMKKQGSLSDELHSFTRQRNNSKAGSVGSASDADSTQDNPESTTQHSATDSPFDGNPTETDSHKSPPPATLPKPHKTPAESPAKPAFGSGFSKKEYLSGIHPSSEGNQTQDHVVNSEENANANSTEHAAEILGELV